METVYIVEIYNVEPGARWLGDIRVFSTHEQATYFIEHWTKNKDNIDPDVKYYDACEVKEDRDGDDIKFLFYDKNGTLKGRTELQILKKEMNDFRGS